MIILLPGALQTEELHTVANVLGSPLQRIQKQKQKTKIKLLIFVTKDSNGGF